MGRLSLVVGIAMLLGSGCAPSITYDSATEVAADGGATRRVVMQVIPPAHGPRFRASLADHLDLTPPTGYAERQLRDDRLSLRGRFARAGDIPSDFRKRTAGTDRLALNRVTVREVDLVLVRVLEYEERFYDIVRRREGALALDGAVRFAIDAAMTVLEDVFGADYDLAGLRAYLEGELPALAQRFHAAHWELRRARRDGITALEEEGEWAILARSQLRRMGLAVESQGLPGQAAFRPDLWRRFADERLAALVRPRRAEVPPLTTKRFKDGAVRKALERSVGRRYGGVLGLWEQFERRLPEAVGAFSLGRFALVPSHPSFRFDVALRMPGRITETNGVLDLDGTIRWRFTGDDVALAGKTLAARSLLVQDVAVRRLGLEGFPDGLARVEALYQLLRDGAGGMRTPVVEALRAAVRHGTLAPLEEAAGRMEAGDAMAARRLVQWLRQRQRPQAVGMEREPSALAVPIRPPAPNPSPRLVPEAVPVLVPALPAEPAPADPTMAEPAPVGDLDPLLTEPGPAPAPEARGGEDDEGGEADGGGR